MKKIFLIHLFLITIYSIIAKIFYYFDSEKNPITEGLIFWGIFIIHIIVTVVYIIVNLLFFRKKTLTQKSIVFHFIALIISLIFVVFVFEEAL